MSAAILAWTLTCGLAWPLPDTAQALRPALSSEELGTVAETPVRATPPNGARDWPRRVGLRDATGEVYQGRVVRVDHDTVVVRVKGREYSVPAAAFSPATVRHDPVTDGATKGMVVGGMLWVGTVLSADHPFAGNSVAVPALIGMTTSFALWGLLIDAAVDRHHLLVAPLPVAPAGGHSSRFDAGGKRLGVVWRVAF